MDATVRANAYWKLTRLHVRDALPRPHVPRPDSGTALMVNIGIVLVFAAFYLKSLKKP